MMENENITNDLKTELKKPDESDWLLYPPAPETDEEKNARAAKAAKQLTELGYVTLANRKSKREIYEALAKSGGMTSKARKLLDCGYYEFVRYISEHKGAAVYWKQLRREMVEKAETTVVGLLDSNIEQNRFNAAKYILDRLGAADGWTPAQMAQQIEITNDDKTTTIKQIFGIDND